MTQPTWRDGLEPVTRPDDGEHIGYLAPRGDADWDALNLLGIRLGTAETHTDARRKVIAEAMASLAQPWWCRAPRPLPAPIVHARAVGEEHDWERVVIVEVSSERALVRPMYAWPEETGHVLAIDLPATNILYDQEPRDYT